ncbi:DNA-methyltransferase [Granulicella cerasi]|uniref:Methyltransferase n=1 Tax=Granulicella cerasi TaxID=741063 RepID=A0ABW1Z6V8_9BACT|nr:site-specific DNA-methyltransferase [Granulicella cerasi]
MSNATTQLMLGDCLEQMKSLPDNSVDMVLTDLPYGTTGCTWDSIIPLEKLWVEWRRICKPNAAIVLTASQPFTTALIASNLKAFRYCWVWEKDRHSNFQLAKKQPLKQHEDVVVFAQRQPTYNPQGLIKLAKPKRMSNKEGSRRLQHIASAKKRSTYLQEWTGYPKSVLKLPTERGHHPTQKPVALCDYLIRTYTHENDTVLDCTMGSGTTGVAAMNTVRCFIGIERDAAYFNTAKARINAAEEKIMNPLQTIETIGMDIAHVAEQAVAFLPHVVSLLDHAIKDEPEVKTLLSGLITQAIAVLTAGSTAAEDKGISLAADATTLAAAEQFFMYVKGTFLPQAEAIYKEISSDIR